MSVVAHVNNCTVINRNKVLDETKKAKLQLHIDLSVDRLFFQNSETDVSQIRFFIYDLE